MTTDLTDRLSALRPAPELPTGERDDLLERILATDRASAPTPHAPARRRRVLAGAAVIGLAAAAAVTVPALLPSSPGGATPAAAAELQRLAVITGHHRSVVLGADQYWYVEQTSVQTGACCDEDGNALGTLRERRTSWTDQHGNVWRRDAGTGTTGRHSKATYYFPAHADSFESPDFLAALPDDADGLRDYLRSHAEGSDSVDEAVFVAIEPLLQGGIATAQLRAAAVQVLAGTDHVSLTRDARDSSGRSAERFDYVDDSTRPGVVQSIYFDPDTAQVLETSTTAPDGTYVDTVQDSRVTDSVPAAIRHDAVPQD